MNLKGNVAILGHANFVDGKGLFTYTFFNEDGNIIKTYRSLDKYKVFESLNYENNKIAHSSSISFYEPDDLNDINVKYEYQDNVLMKKIETSESAGKIEKTTTLYVVNKDKEVIYSDKVHTSGYAKENSSNEEIYSFYELHKKIKDSTIYNPNGGNEISTYITLFKYDNEGNKISEEWSVKDENEYWYKRTYKKGLEIEFQNPSGTNFFEYKFDSNGNWIEKKIKGAKEPDYIRVIVYKGEDLSKYQNEYDETIVALTKIKNKFSGSKISPKEIYSQNNNDFSQNSTNTNDQSSINKKKLCSRCNGSGRCDKCYRNQKVYYHNEGGSLKYRDEIKLGYVVCTTCLGVGYSGGGQSVSGWNKKSNCSNYCSNGWVECKYCNQFPRGNLGSCKSCNGTGYVN